MFRFHNTLTSMFRSLAATALAISLAGAAAESQMTMQLQTAPPPTLDTVKAGKFDNGKMWTFEYAPTSYLRETYNFNPDSSWYRRARLGALRIPGCSASLVSARGLVMTNHHCGRDAATEVKRPGENILDNGFYARAEGDERRAEGMYADQLIAIVDVTSEIDSSARGVTEANAAAARTRAGEMIKERLVKQHGEGDTEVEIISLWNGAKTSAYVFKRYKDVRLVMTPELQLGYFGGDPDNFTYPRYAFDFTFFRLYGADGKPLATPDHFRWSTDGVKAGDLTFVIGNPGSTSRLQTVTELEYRRDVSDAALLRLISDRVDIYEEFIKDNPGAPEETRNQLFEFLNAEKAYGGIVRGLNDPYIMARRRADERSFREAVRSRAELEQKYGSLFDQMARLQERKRGIERDTRAFVAFGNPALDASVLVRAIYASRWAAAKAGNAPAAALEQTKGLVLGVPSQPAQLQEGLLAARLRDLAWAYGASSTEAQSVLGGQSPEVAAAAIMKSVLADSAATAKALEAGTLPADDPAIKAANALMQHYGRFSTQRAQLTTVEEGIAREIGRARFEVYGLAIPPDATFSLRIADGVVAKYEYNGTVAPVHTTMYGLFDRYYSHGGGDWALPKRWLDKERSLNLSTPVNFVTTADIIGGNSGSPVVDKDLRVVGLVFDGNIESLPGDYIYMPERARAVAVDVRGILEALRVVYGADRLARELTGR